MSVLAGVVLAGGLSSRMGKDKSVLTLPQSQLTLLEVAQRQLSLLCDSQVFVSGAQHDGGIPDLANNCGPLAGIYSSLSYLAKHHPNVTHVLFAAVDMPNLQLETYRELVRHGEQQQGLYCFENSYLPLYISVPKLVMGYIAEQLKIDSEPQTGVTKKCPNYSIKNMLKVLGGRTIPMCNNSPLDNINTPSQWQRFCNEKNNIKVENSE